MTDSNICNEGQFYVVRFPINGSVYTKYFSKKKYSNALELAENYVQYLKDTHY